MIIISNTCVKSGEDDLERLIFLKTFKNLKGFFAIFSFSSPPEDASSIYQDYQGVSDLSPVELEQAIEWPMSLY